MTDEFLFWAEESGKLFGGMEILTVDAIRANGRHYIIEINDTASGLYGPNEKVDMGHISELVVQKLNFHYPLSSTISTSTSTSTSPTPSPATTPASPTPTPSAASGSTSPVRAPSSASLSTTSPSPASTSPVPTSPTSPSPTSSPVQNVPEAPSK